MKRLFSFALLIVSAIGGYAQQARPVEMADALRSSGKIYVVIATIVIIFIGLAIYLFAIDRRLKRLEKDK